MYSYNEVLGVLLLESYRGLFPVLVISVIFLKRITIFIRFTALGAY